MSGRAGHGDGERLHPRGAYMRLKAATRLLCKGAGGLEAAAMVTVVDHSTLGRYQAPHEAQFVRVDVVADLEQVAGAPFVTRELAALAGHVLVPAPPAFGDPRWIGHMAAVAKESGEAIARLGAALANDGVVTADESRALGLLKETREAIEQLTRLQVALEQLEGVRRGEAEGGARGEGEA